MKTALPTALGTLIGLGILTSAAGAQQFSDDFDTYAPGNLGTQNNWDGWDGDPAAIGDVVAGPARSQPNSLAIDNAPGLDDTVQELDTCQGGQWEIRAHMFVPTGFTGQSFFILLNTYSAGGPKNWSTQVLADAATGTFLDTDGGASLPLIFDAWVEVRVVIDLDTNMQTVCYGGEVLFTDSWTEHASGGGVLDIAALDLFSNNGTVVYWDDICFNRLGCSQSVDEKTILTPFNIACQAGGIPTDNAYLRRYDPVNDCGMTGDFVVTGVDFGIEIAESLGGSLELPANVRLYTVPPGVLLTYATMTLVHDEPIEIPLATQDYKCVPLCNPVRIPAGLDLVVEVFAPDGAATGNRFFLGANDAGASGASYLAAAACGLPEPLDLTSIGFDMIDYVLDVTVAPLVGEPGDPACVTTANSTGLPGVLTAVGSNSVAANDLTLIGSQLPSDNFGYCLASDGNIVFQPPSSNGNFCLGSPNPGNIGRFIDQLANTGPGGCMSCCVDLTAVPIAGPAVPEIHVIVPGETWYFQLWYRDAAGSPNTNNFTDAICVTFTN